MVKDIQERILSYPGVLGTHDLMIHDYGPGRQFASVHVEMAAEDDPLESHTVIDNMEHDFLEKDGLQFIVHLDPIPTSASTGDNLSIWLNQEVKVLHEEMSIHDLRCVPGSDYTKLMFDCVKPPELSMEDKEIKAAISALVKREHPNYKCFITVDKSYAPFSQLDTGGHL